MSQDARHTYGPACPRCPGRAGAPGRCDEHRYTSREIRFLLAHLEEYEAGGSSERLLEEYRYVPFPGHGWCLCRCPQQRRTGVLCAFCTRRRQALAPSTATAPRGRSSLLQPPLPRSAELLDLARAASRSKGVSVASMTAYLNAGEG